jgi:hypothetical protein
MNNDTQALQLIVFWIIRLICIPVTVSKAKSLNRSVWGWSIFAFFIPIVAVIWIQFKKPLMVWRDGK